MHERGALETRGLAAQLFPLNKAALLNPPAHAKYGQQEADPIRFLRFENYVGGGSTDSLSTRHTGCSAFLPMNQTGEGTLERSDVPC
jgi:hypothetical protein